MRWYASGTSYKDKPQIVINIYNDVFITGRVFPLKYFFEDSGKPAFSASSADPEEALRDRVTRAHSSYRPLIWPLASGAYLFERTRRGSRRS